MGNVLIIGKADIPDKIDTTKYTEVWSINKFREEATHIFDIHLDFRTVWDRSKPVYVNHKITPVYNEIRYPFEDVLECLRFQGPERVWNCLFPFCSTVDYAIGLANLQKYDISIVGIGMQNLPLQRVHELKSIQFWLGYSEASGLRVETPLTTHQDYLEYREVGKTFAKGYSPYQILQHKPNIFYY